MKKVAPIPKILNYESYAFIGPHPDDIEVACGATVAKLSKMGKRICFIVATDGRYGSRDINIDIEKLIETRKAEAISAAKSLGVNDVRFLGFPDGGDYNINDMKDKMAIELAKFKPDIIFAADNHVKAEIHPDHINAGRAAEIAMYTCMFPLIMKNLGVNESAFPKGIAYYYSDKPNRYINVSKTLKDKFSALEHHKSQFLIDEQAQKEFKLISLYLKITAIRFGLKRFCRYAESYRVLSILHTHCAPEASDF